MMNIKLALTDDEILACSPVMRELRPHIPEDQFLARIRAQGSNGYQLAYVESDESVAAVAGFRIGENLAWGKFLYIDDLVTLATQRSHGYGAMLLSWLREYAVKEGCAQVHLDSGLHRLDAHRFYEREGMIKASFHFSLPL